jgi:hypothetical protein
MPPGALLGLLGPLLSLSVPRTSRRTVFKSVKEAKEKMFNARAPLSLFLHFCMSTTEPEVWGFSGSNQSI